jgi:predicted Zn-dependent peptidase
MSYELNFRAGEYLVKPDKWETPHLMEHVLLGANQTYRKARLFQAEIEKNGAYSNASTGVYDITYEAECADFEWDRVLDLMLLAVAKPLFLEEEFTAEFGNVREELQARSNNHFRHLSLALREYYGFMAKTDQERLNIIDNVTLDDVRRHYKRTHTTRNLRFVIAGRITDSRRAGIKAALESMEMPEGTERFALPDEVPHRKDDPLFLHNATVKNVYFYIDSFMNRRMSDPESDALGLVNTMLTETLYSKILGTAREQGLVYSMSSGFGQTKLNSNWWFGAQVSKKNVSALFDIITREMEDVFKGNIDAADIEASKAYSIGRFQRSAQTVAGTAGGYSSRYFFDESIEDYFGVPQRIKAINKSGIVSISRDLFKDDVWGLGVLSDCSEETVKSLQSHVRPLWDSFKD